MKKTIYVTVYAIEASDMATQTKAIVDENKMADRIDVIHNVVEVTVLGLYIESYYQFLYIFVKVYFGQRIGV